MIHRDHSSVNMNILVSFKGDRRLIIKTVGVWEGRKKSHLCWEEGLLQDAKQLSLWLCVKQTAVKTQRSC